MAELGRPGLPETERRQVWDLCKKGHSFSEISNRRCAAGISVFDLATSWWDLVPEPTPLPGELNLAAREEISRGLAANKSLRTIDAELGRAPSTISREIAKTSDPHAIGRLTHMIGLLSTEPVRNG